MTTTEEQKPKTGDPWQIVVSVPRSYGPLKEDIQKVARNQHRSVSNLIIMLLYEYVERELGGAQLSTHNTSHSTKG